MTEEKRSKKLKKREAAALEEEENDAAPQSAEPQKQEKRKRLDAEEEVADAPNIDNSRRSDRGGRGFGRGVSAEGSSMRGRGRGVGGRGRGEGESATARPSAVKMLKTRAGRKHTISVALPASIVDNAQSEQLKAVLVGQMARALTIYSVDEVVIYEDRSDAKKNPEDEGLSQSLASFVRLLQYLETPQYLRRQLVPMHKDLKFVGLLSPLDAPHHLRKNEHLAYREGAVLAGETSPAPPRGEEGKEGCWVNCGMDEPVWVLDQTIPSGVRVTVRIDDEADASGHRRGVAVPPREPTTKLGLYWGYQTRIAKSLRAVMDECPYDGGYDFSMGTSERGESMGLSRLPKFQHFLLCFGGVGGLEDVVDDQLSGYTRGTDPASLFKRYVNVCPGQTSRTIRTEEALIISLASLSPLLPERS